MIKVIIPASGTGTRFGAGIPKQFIELNGQQILKHTISRFQSISIVDEIIVAVPPGYTQHVADYGFGKVSHIIEGGKDRASSVYLALKMLPTDSNIVLIHDGVRPFVTSKLVQNIANAVTKHGAAIAGVPITDTVKIASANLLIAKTLDRNHLWSIQTPQGFTYSIIMEAYSQAEKDCSLRNVTDDSMLVERLNIPVHVVPSCKKNIKITTQIDLIIAETYLAKESEIECEK